MIISYEKHLNDFLNREQSLQKIIQNQDIAIKDLEKKLNEKTEHLVLPLKMRYESEISLKTREINDLRSKLQEIHLQYNDEKVRYSSVIESNNSTNSTLQRQLEVEKEEFRNKSREYASTLKEQLDILTEENIKLYEENEKLRNDLIKLTKEKTQFEMNIEEFNDYITIYKEKETTLLAENLSYKGEIESLRKNLEDVLLINQKEKKLLQKKIDEMNLQIKSNENDMKYELEQFKSHVKELNKEGLKKASEVIDMKISKEKIIAEVLKEKEDLEHQLNSQREEFLNDLKKKNESFEQKFQLLSKEMIIINEEKSNELEKFIREIEILKNEKVLYEKNLEEAKNALASREGYLNSELVRQKIALDKLIELGSQRENILQEDTANLQDALLKLQKAYESKENNINNEKLQGKNCLEILEKIFGLLKNIEEKIENGRKQDNHKIHQLAKY